MILSRNIRNSSEILEKKNLTINWFHYECDEPQELFSLLWSMLNSSSEFGPEIVRIASCLAIPRPQSRHQPRSATLERGRERDSETQLIYLFLTTFIYIFYLLCIKLY